MEIILLVLGLIIGGGIAWQVVKGIDQAQYTAHIKALEAKFRLTQNQSETLKEQVAGLNGEVLRLEKNLGEERASKTEAITHLSHSYQKSFLVFTVIFFVAGVGMGGGVFGYGATLWTKAKTALENAEFQINSEVYRLRAESLQKEKEIFLQENATLREKLLTETETKTIALTKLRILLESLTPHRGAPGFELDYQELQNNLNDKPESNFLQYGLQTGS